MIFKFKSEADRLLKLSILSSIIFISVCVVILIIVKLYFPIELVNISDINRFLGTSGYIGLFFITFLGGTVIPLGSPAAVASAGLLGMPKFLVMIVSATGYTLGVTINYLLAYKLGSSYVENKISEEVFRDLVSWWNRWGMLLVITFALFPILPFDLIALLCGLFRFNFIYFILINFGGNLVNSYVFLYIGTQAGLWLGLL